MSQQQPEAVPLETFTISAEAETKTKTRVTARDFEYTIDEPENLGGENSAPTPVEYVSGAWAGCLTVVAHKVADEQDIHINSLSIDIEGEIDPRKFLGQSDDPRAGYQELRVNVQVDADADADALKAWFDTVESRCPVGDNLTNPTPATTKLTIE